MDKFATALKATCLVLGGLALVGLIAISFPILQGIGAAVLGLLAILAIPAAIVFAIWVVYYVLSDESRRKGGKY